MERLSFVLELHVVSFQLWKPIEKALNVLDALILSNHSLTCQNVVEILDNLLPLFKSPLSAGKAAQLWLDMGRACLPNDPYFGKFCSFPLRLLGTMGCPPFSCCTRLCHTSGGENCYFVGNGLDAGTIG